MASMDTASMKPLLLNFRLTTRYEMIMLSRAVMGAAMRLSTNESRKAWKP